MIMPRSSDRRQRVVCPGAGLELVLVDTTDSSRALDHRQSTGSTAALVLAEALSAVALLGAGAEHPDEVVRLEMQVDGPVRGLCVECSGDGALRGFVEADRLPELDQREELDTREALGDLARAVIRRVRDGRIVEDTVMPAVPAVLEDCLHAYYSRKLSTPVAVSLAALAYGPYLELARGLLLVPLPGGPAARSRQLDDISRSGMLTDLLESSPSLSRLCEELGLAECRQLAGCGLRFGCVCADGHVDRLLGNLPEAELAAMISGPGISRVTCRMCGERYPVPPERAAAALRERRSL